MLSVFVCYHGNERNSNSFLTKIWPIFHIRIRGGGLFSTIRIFNSGPHHRIPLVPLVHILSLRETWRQNGDSNNNNSQAWSCTHKSDRGLKKKRNLLGHKSRVRVIKITCNLMYELVPNGSFHLHLSLICGPRWVRQHGSILHRSKTWGPLRGNCQNFWGPPGPCQS